MKHLIRAIIFIAVGLFATTASASSIRNFLNFGGIRYIDSGRNGRELRDEDLGAEVTKVKFKFPRADASGRRAPEPSYGPDEAYAASLDVGTSIYAVKGYATTFRLAARRDGRIVLYEANTNPKAQKGADLLDLGTNVAYIGINADEGDARNEIGAIKDSALLARLVRIVLDAPVNRDNKDYDTGPRYFIVIHFRDGTTSPHAYWLNSGELSRGIMLPTEFADAVRDALKQAGHSPPK